MSFSARTVIECDHLTCKKVKVILGSVSPADDGAVAIRQRLSIYNWTVFEIVVNDGSNKVITHCSEHAVSFQAYFGVDVSKNSLPSFDFSNFFAGVR